MSAPFDVVSAPVPDSNSVVVGVDPLDVNDAVAVTVPFACGLKLIVTGRLLPGSIVNGNWVEGKLNSELSTVAPETTRFPPLEGPLLES